MELAGIQIPALSEKEALEKALTCGGKVFFLNAHGFTVSRKNPDYLEALQGAELLLNDGVGLELAGKLLSTPFRENLNGTDWIPKLLKALEPGTSLFLLGATQEVIARAAHQVKNSFSHLHLLGHFHGYDPEGGLKEIEKLRPQVVLVGMGVPLQELFIHGHWSRLKGAGVNLAVAGGAIFDFLGKEVKRAPTWMRRARLEWLYRFFQEPRRLFARYFLGAGPFAWLVLKGWWEQKVRN